MESQVLRELRWLKAYSLFITLVVGSLFVTGFGWGSQKQKITELDVERINVIDDQGRSQLVISGPTRFPDPVVKGQVLKGARSIKPAGFVFYDRNGNEVGGLATAPYNQTGKISLLAFDYSTAEAIGFNRIENEDGTRHAAGFYIFDPPPVGTKLEDANSRSKERFAIENDNKDVHLSLFDAEGKKRIRLMVDHTGDASFQILDKSGKVVFQAPK